MCRRSGVPSRSFFPQKKRRCPNAPRTKAAVCGAQLRARAKHAEKETGENRGKLACIRFLRFLFRYRLPRHNCSQLPISTQVLCFFLDSRKKRSPRSLSLCVTSSRRGFPCIGVQPRPPRQSVPSPRPCCIPLHRWHRRDRRRDNARQLH